MKTFWGVPLWLCALVSLTLTVVWLFVWPRDRASSASGVRLVVLRWFHALTWALLTLAAVLGMVDQPWSPALGRTLALSSLAAYLVFLAAVFGLIR